MHTVGSRPHDMPGGSGDGEQRHIGPTNDSPAGLGWVRGGRPSPHSRWQEGHTAKGDPLGGWSKERCRLRATPGALTLRFEMIDLPPRTGSDACCRVSIRGLGGEIMA